MNQVLVIGIFKKRENVCVYVGAWVRGWEQERVQHSPFLRFPVEKQNRNSTQIPSGGTSTKIMSLSFSCACTY